MPCFYPKHAIWTRGVKKFPDVQPNIDYDPRIVGPDFYQDLDRKSELVNSVQIVPEYDRLFRAGLDVPDYDDRFTGENLNTKFACGSCKYCLMERARCWSVRCSDEIQMHSSSSFITLTFNDEWLKREAPDSSLSIDHYQRFIKRIRDDDRRFRRSKGLPPREIRYFVCGEYMKSWRPHYHLLLFNFDHWKLDYLKTVNGNHYYTSPYLSKVWKYGFHIIGEANYATAGYIARYCLKKVNGPQAEAHYKRVNCFGDEVQLKPEFLKMSTKPGIGAEWFNRYWRDIYPHDYKVVKGRKTRPPRYYDKLLQRFQPEMYEFVKDKRFVTVQEHDEKSHADLMYEMRAMDYNVNKLVREYEALH